MLESKISEKDCLNLNMDSFILLDVRSPKEYHNYHIPTAINISLDRLSQSVVNLLLTHDKIIITYCQSGIRSLKAVEVLNNFGYQAYNLGGIDTISTNFIKTLGQKS